MSLTKPFFNAIPAFNASTGGTIQLNVLGGDTITAYGYTIYDQSTGVAVLTTEVGAVGDRATNEIRTFPISVGAGLLTNNNIYNIIAYTSNGITSSPYSTPAVFNCYISPTLSGTINNISGMIVNGSTAKVVLSFDKHDVNSPAVFSNATLTLWGKNKASGEFDTLYTTKEIYNLGTAIDVSGLIANVDQTGQPVESAPYSEYKITAVGVTQDLSPLSFSIEGLYCYYAQATDPTIFSAVNIPESGKIKLTSNLVVASGTASADIPYSQDGNYYTANLSGITATWHPTTLHEPFTARFWVGDLKHNTEFATLKSDDYGGEIELTYNNDEKKVLATLKRGASTIRTVESNACDELVGDFEYFSNAFSIGSTGYLTSATKVGNKLYALYGTTKQDIYEFDGFNLGTKYEISAAGAFGSGAKRIVGDNKYIYIFAGESDNSNKMGIFDTTTGITRVVSLNNSTRAVCRRIAQNSSYVYMAGDFIDGDGNRSSILAYNKATGLVESKLIFLSVFQSFTVACTEEKVYIILTDGDGSTPGTEAVIRFGDKDLSSESMFGITMPASFSTKMFYDMFVYGEMLYFTTGDASLWKCDIPRHTFYHISIDVGSNNHIIKYTDTQYCIIGGDASIGSMQFFDVLTGDLTDMIGADDTSLGSFGMAYLISDGILLVRNWNYGQYAYYQQHPMTFVGVQCDSSMNLNVKFEVASRITFNSNGGTAIPDILTNSLLQIASPTPTRLGYTFGGWYIDAGLTTAVTYPYAPKRPVTLHAKWNM